jgi:predicted dehydrogenase
VNVKKVALAGTGNPATPQHHQRDMYLPAVQAVEGAEVSAVLAGPDMARASDLADRAGVEVSADPDAAIRAADLIIVCPDPTHPEMLDHLLTRCHDETTPVLLDKPTLLPSTVLDDLAARFPHTIVGHHPRLHPAVQAARSRVTSGELGLVHAIHGELLSGPADGDHPSGELRNLAVYALDVVQSMFGGPMRGTGHITSLPATQDCGEAHTVALRLHPDVVVTLLVGRAGPPPPTSASHRTSEHHILHRYRVLGSHGQLLVDLDAPGLDILGGQRRSFGPTSVQLLVEAALDASPAPDLVGAARLAGIIDALERSRVTGQPVPVGAER